MLLVMAALALSSCSTTHRPTPVPTQVDKVLLSCGRIKLYSTSEAPRLTRAQALSAFRRHGVLPGADARVVVGSEWPPSSASPASASQLVWAYEALYRTRPAEVPKNAIGGSPPPRGLLREVVLLDDRRMVLLGDIPC